MSTTIEKLQKIINTKKALQTSINNKGGAITDDTPFDEYPLAVDGISTGGGGTEPEDSVAYYKRTRPNNWPYFPLPSEMTEEDDVIYLLYAATDFRCCPAFSVIFASCTCMLYKYMDTEVVSEETLSFMSGAPIYLQYDDSQADYDTFNYVLIKLQGSITELNTFKSKFNGVSDTSSHVSELIEVSGKCNACDISNSKFHPCIKYYSFLGVSSTSMVNMFNDCRVLQAIPELDTSNVTNMQNMFNHCYSLHSIPELDTSNVTNMHYMFSYCYSLHSIPELDTSNVANMSRMFYYCYSLQSIPQLDTNSVTDMSYMFYFCSFLQTIPLLNTSNVTNISYMFRDCTSLQSVPLLNTSNVTNMSSLFQRCFSLRTIPLLNTSNVTNISYIFSSCGSLQSIPELDTSSVTNMSNMLSECSCLQSIPLLDTSKVTNMQQLFNGCNSLQSIPSLDTSKVTNISSMFQYCSSLQRINILNPALSFSISDSRMFQREDLLTILNNLATVETSQTLTMGSTNLAKLTDEDKLIATNKGWTLA